MEEHTEEELITAVIEKYNINEETAARDIRGFLQQLSKNGILHNRKHGDDYLESLALYRKLCEKMLEYDIFLLHCSAVAVDGKAYLCTSPRYRMNCDISREAVEVSYGLMRNI